MRYWSFGAAFGAFAIALAGQAYAAGSAPHFGHPPESQCRTCKSAAGLRAQTEFPVPRRGVVYDFSNGVFWRNSYRLVVDFDRAEAITYRMPADVDQPTKMVVSGRKAVSEGELKRLVQSVGAVWNPPIPKTLDLPHTDIFERLLVADGPVVGEWLEMGGGAPWFVDVRERLWALVVR